MTTSCPFLSRSRDGGLGWETERIFDLGEEGFGGDWFGDEIGSARFEAGVTGKLAGEAGHDNDGSRGGNGMLAKGFADNEAVQAGQQEVE